MVSKNTYKLINEVMNASESDKWDTAVYEWKISDCIEDEECESECICGKENIKYLYTITNEENGNDLSPIGSSCIKKFQREDLNETTQLFEQRFRLLRAFEEKNFIDFSSKLFSKKLLKFLYKDGCFISNEYNGYDPRKDYQFLIDMFNKRNPMTPNQDKKVKAIIMSSICPYLQLTLKKKNTDISESKPLN